MKLTPNLVFVFPAITPMVQNAKALSTNPQNSAAANNWRKTNQQVRLSCKDYSDSGSVTYCRATNFALYCGKRVLS